MPKCQVFCKKKKTHKKPPNVAMQRCPFGTASSLSDLQHLESDGPALNPDKRLACSLRDVSPPRQLPHPPPPDTFWAFNGGLSGKSPSAEKASLQRDAQICFLGPWLRNQTELKWIQSAKKPAFLFKMTLPRNPKRIP